MVPVTYVFSYYKLYIIDFYIFRCVFPIFHFLFKNIWKKILENMVSLVVRYLYKTWVLHIGVIVREQN